MNVTCIADMNVTNGMRLNRVGSKMYISKKKKKQTCALGGIEKLYGDTWLREALKNAPNGKISKILKNTQKKKETVRKGRKKRTKIMRFYEPIYTPPSREPNIAFGQRRALNPDCLIMIGR